jgi:hypothetical protein
MTPQHRASAIFSLNDPLASSVTPAPKSECEAALKASIFETNPTRARAARLRAALSSQEATSAVPPESSKAGQAGSARLVPRFARSGAAVTGLEDLHCIRRRGNRQREGNAPGDPYARHALVRGYPVAAAATGSRLKRLRPAATPSRRKRQCRSGIAARGWRTLLARGGSLAERGPQLPGGAATSSAPGTRRCGRSYQ